MWSIEATIDQILAALGFMDIQGGVEFKRRVLRRQLGVITL